MNGTIKRGTARRPAQPARRKARAPKKSRVDVAIGALPVSEAALRRAATWSIMGATTGAALLVLGYFGVPQAAAVALAEQVGKAGFRVQGIEVTGARRMDPMTVYAVVLGQKSRALPLVDVADVRARLRQYPWIADAQVSRRLPDRLVVHIVEREPAAIWQHEGALMLIDAQGRALEGVSPDAMPNLPLLIGDGANAQAPAYRDLLESAPALKPMVRAATWVGNRRWNLTFTTGETLALPENGAGRALSKFAAKEGATPLLGKGWLKFDMRKDGELIARKPGAGALRALADSAAARAPAAAPSPTNASEG